MSKKFWTPEEIRLLVQAYKEGYSEKKILSMLDRTHSSVSKKIDALGLRALYRRRQKNVCNKEERKNTSPAIKELQQAFPFSLSPLERMSQETPEGRDHNGLNWVTFSDVMQWLESMGTLIRRSSLIKAPYLFDGKYLSEAQVLLLCNRMRLEQSLPIVHVPGITELE